MDPERWQRIKGIFHHARELAVSEQGACLDEACGDDEDLRREVEALLVNRRRAGDFMEGSALSHIHDTAAGEDGSLVGRRLGVYRILRRIGHGGMGAVYLAERCDDEYRRRVGIKVLKLGMDSDFLVERFRQERQILANLDHPGIARLLDGGTLEDGRPYLVMEHIDGEPIDRYCARQRLSIRRILELFRRVCDAVHFAHRNLVIHRDLKPSNILVTADGDPKLLDFGTAKLLATSDAFTAPVTAAGLRLLTPDYASPEQLRAERITTATDVYSLGVVLYELLTGRRPYRVSGSLSPQEVRMVCEQEPPRPSTVARLPETGGEAEDTPRAARRFGQWRRALSGDLDNIVLMAMRKEPARRYSSVEQLSQDLRRHLANQPVVARPDTLSYRAGKFIRRHHAGVAAAVLVFVTLVGGIVAATWQARRAIAASERAERHLAEATAQRRTAERQRARAEEVSRFLVDLFEESDPGEALGEEVTAREMLDRGARRIADELRDQPELQAMLMDTMGGVYHKLGRDQRATELLEEALVIRRGLGDRHPDLASILGHLGVVWLERGEPERAEPLLEEALVLRRELLGPRNAQIVESLDDLGSFHYARGDYEKAQALHEEALAMRRGLSQGPDPEIAVTLSNLAAALLARGEVDAAEERLRAALTIRRQRGDLHPDIAQSLNNLAAVLQSKGDLAEAAELFEEAVTMRRRLYGAEGHRHLATALDNLATVLVSLDRVEEAETRYVEALELRRRLLGARHPDVAFSLNNLAVLHQETGDLDEAETLYRRALEVWSEAKGDEHPDARLCRHDLAWLLYSKGDDRAAAAEFRRLSEIQRQLLPADDLGLSTTLLGLGLALRRGGDPDVAVPHLREAHAIRRRLPADDAKIASAAAILGECLSELGRYEEAEPLLLSSHALTERTGDDTESARARRRVIDLYRAWGRPDAAAGFQRTWPAR